MCIFIPRFASNHPAEPGPKARLASLAGAERSPDRRWSRFVAPETVQLVCSARLRGRKNPETQTRVANIWIP
jgi:hypothetical protein